MKAVIIAGGKGERLRPVTYEIAKALIPVQGRPLIDHSIDLLWQYKVYEIWFSLGYLNQQIRDKYPSAPFFLDRDITDGKIIPLGTGGWLNRLALNNDEKKMFNDDFVVLNADNLFNLNLSDMIKEHRKSRNVVTIACTHVKDIRQYGAVNVVDNKIMSFEEKPRIKKSGWINGGYYIFGPEIFKYIKTLDKKPNEPVSLERDVFPLVAKDGKLGAFKSDGQWFDTGTFERWEKVLKEWKGIR
jgi:NDP-sugar pyrophosphorylase family protein